jgi:hypothetical protein
MASLAEFFGECVEAFLDFQTDPAPVSNLCGQWGRQVLLEDFPGIIVPPLVWCGDAVGEHQTAGAFEAALFFLGARPALA